MDKTIRLREAKLQEEERELALKKHKWNTKEIKNI